MSIQSLLQAATDSDIKTFAITIRLGFVEGRPVFFPGIVCSQTLRAARLQSQMLLDSATSKPETVGGTKMKIVSWLNLRISLLIGAALAIGALPLAVNVAYAQEDTSANADDEVEEIIVTGSRIRRAGFDTLQPAVQIDAEFIETRGFINIADAINEVPTFGPPGSGPVGQGTGTAVDRISEAGRAAEIATFDDLNQDGAAMVGPGTRICTRQNL